MQIFRLFRFRLRSFYPIGINIGSKQPQLLLKHAEKQSDTRRVQSFGAKSGAGVANPQPSSLKIDLKALMHLFRKLHKSFVGLEEFRRYCGLKFKHPIFGWIQNFCGQLKVNIKHMKGNVAMLQNVAKSSLCFSSGFIFRIEKRNGFQ